MAHWASQILDILWRQALALIPLVLIVALAVRVFPLRPATKHMLWFTVLAWLVIAPLLPSAPRFSLPGFDDLFARTPRHDGPEHSVEAAAVADDNARSLTSHEAGAYAAMKARSTVMGAMADAQDHEMRIASPRSGSPDRLARGTVPDRRDRAALHPLPVDDTGFDHGDEETVRSVTHRRLGLPDPNRSFVLQNKLAEPVDDAHAPLPRGLKSAARLKPRGLKSAARQVTTDDTGRTGVHGSIERESRPELVVHHESDGAGPSMALSQRLQQWGVALAAIVVAVRNLPPVPFSVWIGGALLLLTLSMVRWMLFRRYLKQSYHASGPVNAMVKEAAQAYGLKRIPEVRWVRRRLSPMVWTGRRLRLILPEPLWDQLDRAGRRAVIFHELAHIRRKDHWVAWAEVLVGLVYWWHPLVWWVRSRLRAEAEVCCDAWVTTLMPCDRRAYAQALLQAKQYVYTNRRRTPSFAIGVTTGRAGRFARRLTMIMTSTTKPQLSLSGLALMLSLAVTGWLTTPARSCPPNDTTQTEPVKAIERVEVIETVNDESIMDAVAATVSDVMKRLVKTAPCADCSDCGKCGGKTVGFAPPHAHGRAGGHHAVAGTRSGCSKCRKRSGATAGPDCRNCMHGGAKAKCKALMYRDGPGGTFRRHHAGIREEAPKASSLESLALVTTLPTAMGLRMAQVTAGMGGQSGDDNDDDDARLDRLEKKLDKLARQLDRLTDKLAQGKGKRAKGEKGRKSGKHRARAGRGHAHRGPGPRPPRAPRPWHHEAEAGGPPHGPRGPWADRDIGPRHGRVDGDRKIVVRKYELPAGKRDALNNLMVRDDVPIRVRPLPDGIEVHATRHQQRIFRAFVRMIDPSGRDDVDRWFAPDDRDEDNDLHMAYEIVPKAPDPAMAAMEHLKRVRREAREHRAMITQELRTRQHDFRKRLREIAEKAAKLRDEADRTRERADEVREHADQLRQKAERLQEDDTDDPQQQAELKKKTEQLMSEAGELESEANRIEREANEFERQAGAVEREGESVETEAESVKEEMEGALQELEETVEEAQREAEEAASAQARR